MAGSWLFHDWTNNSGMSPDDRAACAPSSASLLLTGDQRLKGSNAEIFEKLPKQQAIPRVIEPEDLVGMVSFFCSHASGFVTGLTIAADGGLVRT